MISSDCPESTREELEKNSLYSFVFPVESSVGFCVVFVENFCSFLGFSPVRPSPSIRAKSLKRRKPRGDWVGSSQTSTTSSSGRPVLECWNGQLGFQCWNLSGMISYDSYDQIISRLVDLLHALGHAGHHQCSSPFIRICRCDRCDLHKRRVKNGSNGSHVLATFGRKFLSVPDDGASLLEGRN